MCEACAGSAWGACMGRACGPGEWPGVRRVWVQVVVDAVAGAVRVLHAWLRAAGADTVADPNAGTRVWVCQVQMRVRVRDKCRCRCGFRCRGADR